MPKERTNREVAASPVAPVDARPSRTYSRRQALGRLSVAAGAGAAAWVVPEILTAKPAAGATMSGVGGTTTGGGGASSNPSNPSSSPSTTGSGGSAFGKLAVATSPGTSPGSALAMTGVDIQRDAELGAALVAGGWAMHRWASRTPEQATEAVTEVHEAGNQADST